MNCQIVINRDSGNSRSLNANDVVKKHTAACDNVTLTYIDSGTDWTAVGYDKIIVCGGDGTLHNALNKTGNADMMYLPCGTLNERAAGEEYITHAGRIGKDYFTYVAAAGSFTEIGYKTPDCRKKKLKFLAYIGEVLKCYKTHEITAKINADGRNYDGRYTLIMFLRSERCFGFRFNKMYRNNGGGLYLLAIRSPGKDCFKNRVKMFFPFFRVFFGKVKRPTTEGNWLFVPIVNAEVFLEGSHEFCLDGEKAVMGGKFNVCEEKLAKSIKVIRR